DTPEEGLTTLSRTVGREASVSAGKGGWRHTELVTADGRHPGADQAPEVRPGAAATRQPADDADTTLRARQADGLTALLAIAVQASVAMSQASTSLVSAAAAQPQTEEQASPTSRDPEAAGTARGPFGTLLRRFG